MKRSLSDLEAHAGGGLGRRFPPVASADVVGMPIITNTKVKMCMQCGTTRTPQWREGPLGPKTLCNACGVKRVRALKAMNGGRSSGKKGPSAQQRQQQQAAAQRQQQAAASLGRTESVDLVSTLQMLAGRAHHQQQHGGAATPPSAAMTPPPGANRRAARGTASTPGSGGRRRGGGSGSGATPLTAAAAAAPLQHAPQLALPPSALSAHDPRMARDAAAAAAAMLGCGSGGAAGLLPPAVHKALAAIAMGKGSAGAESNPTDSGEEISWSPNEHGEAAAGGGGGGGDTADDGRAPSTTAAQQQQQQQRRGAAAAAASVMRALVGEAGVLPPTATVEQLLGALRGLAAQHGAAAGSAAAADPAATTAATDAAEADAAANLLCMADTAEPATNTAATGGGQGRSGLTASAPHDLAASSTMLLCQPPVRPSSPRFRRVSVQSAAATMQHQQQQYLQQQQQHPQHGPADSLPLSEEDLLYLMGPGMQTVARHVAPAQLLHVVRLNDVLAEAQRSAAAAEAAVAAVERILAEKRAAAEAATTCAVAAARALHVYVSDLDAQHALVARSGRRSLRQLEAAVPVAAPPRAAVPCAMGAAAPAAPAVPGRLELLAALQRHAAAAARCPQPAAYGHRRSSNATAAPDAEEQEAAALLGSLHDLAAAAAPAVATDQLPPIAI